MIKSIIIYVFGIVALIGSCSTKKKYVTYDDKDVVRKYCFQCHAPSDSLIGGPLNEMYSAEKENELRLFLRTEFKNDKASSVVDHSKIKLTRKEVESVIIYLKSLN